MSGGTQCLQAKANEKQGGGRDVYWRTRGRWEDVVCAGDAECVRDKGV